LARMLGRIDQAGADIAELEAKIEEGIAPFAAGAARLGEVTGGGGGAAQGVIAEVATDMRRFPTAGHLASWAKFAPGVKQSAGKPKGKATTGHGNSYLARVLGAAAVAAGRAHTFPAGPPPSWENATGAWPNAAAPRRPSWRSAAPSWSSSGTCWPTPPPASTTWAPASTTPASTPSAASATTSASWRPSATGSPSNPPPESARIDLS